jgi:oligoendopeptidase F
MSDLSHPPMNVADWSTVQPHVEALLAAPLDEAAVDGWLRQWNALAETLAEAEAQIYRDVTENTADAAAEQRFEHFVREIEPQVQVAEQALKQRLLAVEGYQPGEDTALLLRRFRNEAQLFRAENVPLESELALLSNQYNKIVGGMSVAWQGEELTLPQANSRLQEPDRAAREALWRKIMQRYLAARDAIDELYLKMLPLRRQSATNADFETYRALRWQQLARFDYTPDDAFTFHDAIEHEVVPLATQLYQKLADRLGIDGLRPWDTEADPYGEPLRPFSAATELEAGGQRIFDQVDPVLAGYFRAMQDGYLDLASRAHKAPGAYCNVFPVSAKPYIFMSAVGTHNDVTTLLHEGGHAFHYMESLRQPLLWNQNAPMEFCEVASMSMELLSAPYLAAEQGGFYSEAEARRAYADQLRKIVLFLPYMAVVDRFQHWVYTEAPAELTPADLDRTWAGLWDRYLPGIDYRDLQAEKESGWQRKGHIFEAPFYYIEYGLAQLGALQVWRNALADQTQAVADYRAALALGYTRSLPELFAAAGARFAFDRQTVGELMALVAEQLALLEA